MERLAIDEVIEHCNKTCDMIEKIAKARGHKLESIESNQFWEHYQVRAWLKELKAYREIGTVEECKGCVLEILEAYNKAIDDFEQKLLEKAPKNYVGDLELGGSVSFLSANSVTKIAEQLNVGGENEQSI